MKKLFLAVLVLAAATVNLNAQTTNGQQQFEGEVVMKMNSYQKVKTVLKTNNLLVKMMIKPIMRKYVEENPDYFNGIYTQTTIVKGKKMRIDHSGKNSVTLILPQADGANKYIVYYPYIKKGYWQTLKNNVNQADVSQFAQSVATPNGQGGTIQNGGTALNYSNTEKLGQINVDGHKCQVYRIKMDTNSDTLGTKTKMNIHNEWAVCNDYDMGNVQNLPTGGGVALKSTSNMVSQTSSDMMDMEMVFRIAGTLQKLTQREVKDEEFEVPNNIKLVDINKKPKEFIKILQENVKYLKKNKLWHEAPDTEPKIYDNMEEDWDY